MIILRFAFFFGALALMSAVLHPLHISVTEINYDEKEKSLEIMSMIFMDDLEATMRNRYNSDNLDILAPKEKSLDDMMREYFTEKMKISLDKKTQKLNYLGHENDGDRFIFYIEIVGVKKWKEISVSNTALIEKFEDQSNLVHITVRENVKSLRLTKSSPTDKLIFDAK
jgi:hypothetical protein